MKPCKYNTLVLILFLLPFFLWMGCSKEKNPIQSVPNVPIQLGIQLENQLGTILGPTGSRRNVNTVEVEISGEGMDTEIKQKLDLIRSGNNWEARGSFELPLGNKDIYIWARLTAGNLTFELFDGYKNVDIVEGMSPIIIPLKENTDFEDLIYYHSNTFDQYVLGSPGVVYAAYFDLSNTPVLLKTVAFSLSWEGNPGTIQIFINDNADLNNPRFLSEPLSPPANANAFEWRYWDIIWEPPVEGIFTGVLVVGIYYVDSEYPAMAFDTSTQSQASIFYDPLDGIWYSASSGDFAITAIVQYPGRPVGDRQIISTIKPIKMKKIEGRPFSKRLF